MLKYFHWSLSNLNLTLDTGDTHIPKKVVRINNFLFRIIEIYFHYSVHYETVTIKSACGCTCFLREHIEHPLWL